MNNQLENITTSIEPSLLKEMESIEAILGENALLAQENNHMIKSFKRANLIIQLQSFFDKPDIKKMIVAMQDKQVGFVTDRDSIAIWKSKKAAEKDNRKKVLEAYKWPVVRDCCIEALLSGYHLDGNEFNILVNKMYPAKNGIYRKIVSTEGVTDFKYNLSPARFEQGKAKVQAYATWKKEGVKQSIGIGEGPEDKCFILVKTDAYSNDDSVAGKAARKLFARILPRLGGEITAESEIDLLPESTEIEPSETHEASLSDALQESQDQKESVNQDVESWKLEVERLFKDGLISQKRYDLFKKAAVNEDLNAIETMYNMCVEEAKTNYKPEPETQSKASDNVALEVKRKIEAALDKLKDTDTEKAEKLRVSYENFDETSNMYVNQLNTFLQGLVKMVN